ncbi:TetR/AcrR family transcriptional regulator [Leifsonia shinshuensis]|uniref:TetR family transcriptional regulator n=1 Tax=Leifsonia shinshuensis TaxID=150026 RepID=A0A7G6YBE1_9MICO|nr:TetR family transcriptional regulator [Leifsonia shinshuensis]QNE35806.1 TetR family transcriptional regulator [Leifsonia shinshuensis]
MSSAQAQTGARRFDPDRRDRIIDACLTVIATDGVAGTSHRKVAAAADVPLGSMTYHFSGMEELLAESFTRFADRASDAFERRMRDAATTDEAREAVAELIDQDVLRDPRDLVVTHELYTLAAREPRFRTITQHWMERSRASLGLHFDPATARILDALIEGLTIHRALDTGVGETIAFDAVTRVSGSR